MAGIIKVRRKKFGTKEVNQKNLEILRRETAAISFLKVKKGGRVIYEFSITNITQEETISALLRLSKEYPKEYKMHLIFFRRSKK